MRKVSFEEVNQKNIFYSLSKPNKDSKKIVIMSHGFRGSSIGPARSFVNFEKLLNENDISTLRFDQPCSSNSDGEYIDSSFNEWIATTKYFADKYLQLGYQVILLGQSMGATTTMVATAQESLKEKIPCILLWVPDPKTATEVNSTKVYEEAGQKYMGNFWQEAHDSNFFNALNNYHGGIHLVYGETDKYISKELRDEIIQKVKDKNQQVMVLKGQDHSSWNYDLANKVYEEELLFVLKYFN